MQRTGLGSQRDKLHQTQIKNTSMRLKCVCNNRVDDEMKKFVNIPETGFEMCSH